MTKNRILLTKPSKRIRSDIKFHSIFLQHTHCILVLYLLLHQSWWACRCYTSACSCVVSEKTQIRVKTCIYLEVQIFSKVECGKCKVAINNRLREVCLRAKIEGLRWEKNKMPLEIRKFWECIGERFGLSRCLIGKKTCFIFLIR